MTALLWPLCALVLLTIRPSLCVCLMPTRPSSPSTNEICFDDYNNTDPNIVNHKIDKPPESMVTPNYSSTYPQYFSHSSTESSESMRPYESRANPQIHSIQNLLPKRRRPNRPAIQSSRGRTKAKGSSMFIPVAAYSITRQKPKKKRPKVQIGSRMSASTMSVHRKQRPNIVYEEANSDEDPDEQEDQEEDLVNADESEADDYEMRKESAVYGYIHKPEVIEFRGQYYYGQNGEGTDGTNGGSGINKYDHKAPSNLDYEAADQMPTIMHHQERPHRVSYMPSYETSYHEDHDDHSTTQMLLNKLKKGKA